MGALQLGKRLVRRAHAPYRGVEWRKPQAAHTRPSDAHLCTRCAAGHIARVLHVLLQRHHDSRGVEATMRHDVAPQFRDHVGAYMTANTNGPAHRAQDRVITRPYRGLSTDGVRFELTVRYERTHTFQACALNHSATRPTPFPGRCSRHTPRHAEQVHWRIVATRTGWDSNPRYRCRYAGFRDRFLQPLGHLSQGRREGYSVRKAESTHSRGSVWANRWSLKGRSRPDFRGRG